MCTWKWPYLPKIELNLKHEKTSQNLGRTKLKRVYVTGHQAKEQACPTNFRPGRFAPSWKHFSLSNEKTVISSPVYKEKLHISFINTICQTSVQQNKNKNKSYSLHCLTWCLCKEKNMESMHSSIKY